MDEKSILIVDEQPGKLLTYEAVLSELGENLIKAHSGMEALEHLLKTKHRPRAQGREHARNGWFRADDPRSPALSKHANHHCLWDSYDGPRPAAGISTRSCRLPFRSCGARVAAGQK